MPARPQTALRGAGRGLPLGVRPCTGAAHRGSLCWRGAPLPRPPPPLPGEPLHVPSSDTSEQPTRRQENPGIHTRWPVHMMEYYLAIKRNGVLARAPCIKEPRDVVQANGGEGSQTLRFHVHGTSRRDKSTQTEQTGGRRGGLRGSAGHGGCQGPWGFPLRGGDVLEPAEAWLLHVVTVRSATELRARKRLTLGSRSHMWIFYLMIKNDSLATPGPCHLPAVPACPPALPGCPPPHLWPPPSLRQTPLSLPPTLHCRRLPTLRCWAGSSTQLRETATTKAHFTDAQTEVPRSK